MDNDIWTVRSAGFGRFWLLRCLCRWRKKSKQMDLKDTPEQMSLPINDLPYILLNNAWTVFSLCFCLGKLDSGSEDKFWFKKWKKLSLNCEKLLKNQESSLEKVFKSCYLGEFRRMKIPSIKISLRSNWISSNSTQ